MKNKKEIEIELNKYAVPCSFHDMDLVNMEFLNGDCHMRFTLLKYMDRFNMIEKDNQYAILDVVYKNVQIKDIRLYNFMSFMAVSVLDFDEVDNTICLSLEDTTYNTYPYFSFSFESYNWKLIDIIKEKEYYDFLGLLDTYTEKPNNQELTLPNWADLDK